MLLGVRRWQVRVSNRLTDPVVEKLLDGLTDFWEAALAARRKMSPGSPVGVLDRLIEAGDDDED